MFSCSYDASVSIADHTVYRQFSVVQMQCSEKIFTIQGIEIMMSKGETIPEGAAGEKFWGFGASESRFLRQNQ